jgi:GxxExxY protein
MAEEGADMSDVIYRDESYQIVGACFEVYNQMGSGFLEAVYQECLAMEFSTRGIGFTEKPRLKLNYKEHPLKQIYEPDFLCMGKIILEIKATKTLLDDHRAQVINYLKATGLQLGLLVNFGHHPKLEYERFVHVKAE